MGRGRRGGGVVPKKGVTDVDGEDGNFFSFTVCLAISRGNV